MYTILQKNNNIWTTIFVHDICFLKSLWSNGGDGVHLFYIQSFTKVVSKLNKKKLKKIEGATV